MTEIGRLLRLHEAYRLMDMANEAAAKGDLVSAADAMDQAAQLASDNDQVAFRHGGSLMAVGRVEEGRAELQRARACRAQEPRMGP